MKSKPSASKTHADFLREYEENKALEERLEKILSQDGVMGVYKKIGEFANFLAFEKCSRPSFQPTEDSAQELLINLLNQLQAICLRDNSTTAASLFYSVAHAILDEMLLLEKACPSFRETGVVPKILDDYKKIADARKAVAKRGKNRKNSPYYRAACVSAMLRVILLHNDGWRKHWYNQSNLPKESFGTAGARNAWWHWMRTYLNKLHELRLISTPNEDYGKRKSSSTRSHVRQAYFDELYEYFNSNSIIPTSELLLRAEALNMANQLKIKISYPDWARQKYPKLAPPL